MNVSHQTKDPERGNKREKPDFDSSREEEDRIFRKSRTISRSPTKTHTGNIEIGQENMEEIRSLLLSIQGDIRDLKTEVANNGEETRKLREEMCKMQEEWDKEKEILRGEIHRANEKIEKLEKDRIKNNLVITGQIVDNQNESVTTREIENMIKKEINVQITARNTRKIGDNRYIIELNNWEDKIKILKEKGRLKGKELYIDSELTYKERMVQKFIRDTARAERNRGARTKIGYQKLEINGKMWKWNNRKEQLESTESNATIKMAKN